MLYSYHHRHLSLLQWPLKKSRKTYYVWMCGVVSLNLLIFEGMNLKVTTSIAGLLGVEVMCFGIRGSLIFWQHRFMKDG